MIRHAVLISPAFEAVKLKIQADPEYVGELPYIQLLNPQYRVKTLISPTPETGVGRWYFVTKGTAIGVFADWQVNPLALYSNF